MTTLPASLSTWSHLRYIRKHGECWSSECPKCGDSGHAWQGRNDYPDRFTMWDDKSPRGWCRGCNYFAFAESDRRRLSPSEIERAERERSRLMLAERERQRTKIERLNDSHYWKGYHDALDDTRRKLWREAGIPDSQQDWWELGFNPEYRAKDFTSPALTIPFFHENKCVNMQSRLLNPPNPKDKYRFMYGLPAPLYFPDKDALPSGSCLIVEGAKKAMVMYLHLGHMVDSVVGLPSKHFNERFLIKLSECDGVYVMLDPDAEEQAIKVCQLIGGRARLVTIPTKPDDFIVQYGASGADLWNYIKCARSVPSG